MGEARALYRILVGKPLEKTITWKTGKEMDNLKLNIRKISSDDGKWISWLRILSSGGY
jgi:hypothetical protein